MRVQIQEWGNSLALRIPKPFAEEANVRQGMVVNLSVEEGRLVVSPIADRPFKLRKLLAGVRKDNLHSEVMDGPPTSREAR